MKFRTSPRSPSPHDLEMLSAYLDGQLNTRDQERLIARLHQDPILQALFAELRATRQLLRSTPMRRAPRSFVLTPRMIGVSPRAAQRHAPRAAVPALSFVSVMASLALIAIIVGEMFGLGAATGLPMLSRETAVEQFTLEMEAPVENASSPEQAQETVVVEALLAEESAPIEAPADGVPSEASGELRKSPATEMAQLLPTLTDSPQNPTPEVSEGFPQVAETSPEATPVGLGGGEQTTQTLTSVEDQRASTATSTVPPTASATLTPSPSLTANPTEPPMAGDQSQPTPTDMQVDGAQAETPDRFSWRLAEGSLALLALLAAIGAIILHRRGR